MMTKRLFLARGRKKSLIRRHLWVFSGAVGRLEGKAQPGETIDICDDKGRWLARGAWSPQSQIRARVWSFNPDKQIDVEFFVRRLTVAQRLRTLLAARDGLDGYLQWKSKISK